MSPVAALSNANPLAAISQAMSGVSDMLKSAGSFMEKLTQMPPNLLGAIQDLGNMCRGLGQATEGMQNATGLQMNPMEMLGNMLGIGRQGGGGGNGGGSPLTQLLDALPSPLQMMQSMLRSLGDEGTPRIVRQEPEIHRVATDTPRSFAWSPL